MDAHTSEDVAVQAVVCEIQVGMRSWRLWAGAQDWLMFFEIHT